MLKITQLWLNLSKLCLEYCGLFFPGHGVLEAERCVKDMFTVQYVVVSRATVSAVFCMRVLPAIPATFMYTLMVPVCTL